VGQDIFKGIHIPIFFLLDISLFVTATSEPTGCWWAEWAILPLYAVAMVLRGPAEEQVCSVHLHLAGLHLKSDQLLFLANRCDHRHSICRCTVFTWCYHG